jgi:flagellar hook-associated protein 3 FlgL
MRLTHLSLTRTILHDLERANTRLTKTQQKLSSGLELTRPSDNPYKVGRTIELHSQLEAVRQFQHNVSEAQGWADVTDSALQTITDILHRARELVLQGATDTVAGSPRQQIAEEVRGLIDALKGAANASYGGRYIFAGTATTTQPYQMGADDTYYGNTGEVLTEIGANVTVPINVDGLQAIGDGASGPLGTLRTILAHLVANDGDALRADVAALDAALEQVNALRAKVGATYNRLDVAAARLAQHEETTLRLVTTTEGADMAKAAIEFSTQYAALQASLKAGANIVQSSLLDFLR